MKRSLVALLGTAALSMTLAGCGSKTSSNATQDTFTTVNESRPITMGAPLNPFNTSGNTWSGYDQWQLAWFTNSVTNPNSFIPGLAASWTVNSSGTKVIITLQKMPSGPTESPSPLVTSSPQWPSPSPKATRKPLT